MKAFLFALVFGPLIGLELWLSFTFPYTILSGLLIGCLMGYLWHLIMVEYFRPEWRSAAGWFVEWRTQQPAGRRVGVHVQCGWHGWSIRWGRGKNS